MRSIIVKTKVSKIIKLGDIIHVISARFLSIGTFLFKNWGGDIFQLSGCVRISNMELMWQSRS